MKFIFLLFFAFPTILAAQISTDGLVAHYLFNGNSNDETDFKNNGFVMGATPTIDRFGNDNSAFYFDGNSRVFIPSDSTLDINGDISLCAWVKTESISHTGIVLWRGNELHGLDPYGIGFWDNTVYFFRDISASQSTRVGHAIDNSEITNYHFIASTFNSATGDMKLYIDSVLVKTNNKPYLCEYPTTSYYNMIGNVDTFHNDLGFQGTIDDVRIYNRVLSNDEIQLLYQEQVNTSYYPLTLISDVKIYPNPTTNYFTIDFGKQIIPTGCRAKIINPVGQTVFSSIIQEHKTRIQLNNLHGIYFIHLIDKKNRTGCIKKIIFK